MREPPLFHPLGSDAVVFDNGRVCVFATAAEKSMNIAADTCIYTNHNFTVETIPAALKEEWGALKKA
jgi:hypothetical protein